MRFSTAAALTATAASTASAFLIPPGHVLHPVQRTQPSRPDTVRILTPTHKKHPSTEEDERHTLASLFNLPTAWNLDLPCTGCTWNGLLPLEDSNIETVIEINIDADERNGLVINHIATMQQSTAAPQTVSLVARQRRLDTGERTMDLPLDFVLERLPTIEEYSPRRNTHRKPGPVITPLRFTVVGIAGRPVKVDTLAIDLVQTGREGFKVGRVTPVPFSKTPGAESCEGEAAWSYCRVKAIIRSRVLETIRAMREQGRQAKELTSTHGCGKLRVWHASRRHHKYAKMLHSTLRFFVIPALLGVIGGLVASAVGMVVGQVAVLFWARFGREQVERRSGGSVVRRRIVITSDAKDYLLLSGSEEEELPSPPPRYEDLEAGVVVVEEKS